MAKSKKSSSESEPNESDKEFLAALAHAEEKPDEGERWDALEDLAASLQKPDEVSALYRKVLAQKLAPQAAADLGQRAVNFHEEWFGEGSPQLIEVLTRVLEQDAEAEWALQRLTMMLTVAAKWTELLGTYDRALSVATGTRRIELLREAANVAKDFAGDADRAIGYFEKLAELRPSDAQIAASLERLLEKQERFERLIGIWRDRLDALDPQERIATRQRIAECWLERLDDPGQSLGEVRTILGADPDFAAAYALLEKILVSPKASAETRDGALSILRARFEQEGRAADVVRVIEAALALAAPEDKRALLGDLAGKLVALGRDGDATGHLLALLQLDPGSSDALEQLRSVSAKTGDHARFAQGLVDAARAAAEPARRLALLVESADVRREKLADPEGAIALYAEVLPSTEADAHLTLSVARRLSDLYAQTGRDRERLDVLEKLAVIEPEASERRSVTAEIARLAERLGDADRALAALGKRVEADASDLDALGSVIDLLERAGRWAELVTALERRASAPSVTALQKRADLVRSARLRASELADLESSIAAWRAVGEAFGEDAETADALADLFERTGRHRELAEMLERSVQRESARIGDVRARLGEAYRARLGDTARAADSFRRALELDPSHTAARAGLLALLDDAGAKAIAVDALARAYEATDDWQGALGLLEPRLAGAPSDSARVRILRDAAVLQETRAGDAALALGSQARALPLAPNDEAIEQDVLRLAETTGDFATAAAAVGAAAGQATEGSQRALHLRTLHGTVLESKTGDAAGALDAFVSALKIAPSTQTAGAVVRVAAGLGRWDVVADAILAAQRQSTRFEDALVADAEARAASSGAHAELAAAWSKALPGAGLGAARVRDFWVRLAATQLDVLAKPEAAEAALQHALVAQPDDEQTTRKLADVQRRAKPSRPLYDTLMRLAAGGDVDALHEAAEIALDLPSAGDLVLTTLARLFEDVVRRWRRGETKAGIRPIEAAAQWALDKLASLYEGAGDAGRALALLVEGSRLAFGPEEKRGLLHRAADLARGPLGDRGRAIDLYREILAAHPDDTRAFENLAGLLLAEDRFPELLALRRTELAMNPAPERKLALRLDVARLVGEIEARGGRIEALRDNLVDAPGHEPTIEALSEVYASKQMFAPLAEVLAEQAGKLETAREIVRAAGLWSRAARLAETKLFDVDRALSAHRRVVALSPTTESLDALARLTTERGEHIAAVGWLEQRLSLSTPEERASVSMRLAKAHLAAGQPDRAAVRLEEALAAAPDAKDAREQLAQLYRSAGAWAKLAKLLAEGAQFVTDETALLEQVREAASLYRKLEQPDQAIPVLERAIQLAPDDRSLRTMLAEGLRVAGRLAEARTLLDELVEGFGRRRSAERAQVHFQIALVASAQGNADDALAQLDLATSMDVGNADILRTLGELARQAGQFDRAERAFRALLLIVRRQQPDAELAVGASEVQYELHAIAKQRGQTDQAAELLDSALQSAAQSEAEMRLFRRTLSARGEHELALRALEMRQAQVTEPSARGNVLAAQGEVLAQLGRDEASLDARLKAIDLVPDDAALRDATRATAKRVGRVAAYVTALETVESRLRRKEELPLGAQLLLAIGEAAELDLGDLSAARKAYAKAEATGERNLDAWRALARVAQAAGDDGERVRVLDLIAKPSSGAPVDVRITALYDLGELRLARPGELEAGLAAVRAAIELDPQAQRAGAILRAAAVRTPSDTALLAEYEGVARQSGGDMLLDFLERRAALPTATVADVQEAVDTADRLNESARAEVLLGRACELAASSPEGLAGSLWAPLGLSEKRRAQGDIAGAIHWKKAAVDATEGDEQSRLARELGALAAGPGGDLRLAAQVLEPLRDREPSDRGIWEPLLGVYLQLGDADALTAFVGQTLDALLDPADRNVVRMAYAKHLLAKRDDEGVTVLRAVLDEEPDHVEANGILADLFEKDGRTDDLADLLIRQLDGARDRRDAAVIGQVSLRLGKLYEKADRTQDALDVYKQALESAPEDRPLLDAMLALTAEAAEARDRAEGRERLLAVETGEEAARVAIEVADLYAGLDDEQGVQRALEKGHARAPGIESVRARLEAFYRQREDFAKLADMLALDASRSEDVGKRVQLLRAAAELQRDRLGAPAGAAQMLREALAAQPGDPALLHDLVACLVAAGEPSQAFEEVTRALDGAADGAARADLLRLRARLRGDAQDEIGAVADLEEAYTFAPADAATELVAGLDHLRSVAAERSDGDSERAATLRLVQLLSALGDAQRARDLLATWVARAPEDREALRLLRQIDEAAERWDQAAETCARLVELETGEAQIEAALGLADACEKAGRPGDARGHLELALGAQQTDARLRERLRRVYEQSGASRELATLLFEDAIALRDPQPKFELLRRAGDLFLAAQDVVSAVPVLREAHGLRPDDAVCTGLLVDALIGTGELQEAGQLLEQAIAGFGRRKTPELGIMQLRMARLCAAAGDRETQLEWLKVALDSDKNSGEIAAETADLAMTVGDYDTALKALRAITMMKDHNGPMSRAVAFLRQAQISKIKGDPRRAVLWARKAKEEDAGLAEADDFLRELGE